MLLKVWPSKLHSWNISQQFLVEELKNVESYQCNPQLVKTSHFLQHVKMITTFLLLCLNGDKYLLSGNIRKIEFKSTLLYYTIPMLIIFSCKDLLFFHVAAWRIYVSEFNITSNSRNWRSRRIKNVTARTVY